MPSRVSRDIRQKLRSHQTHQKGTTIGAYFFFKFLIFNFLFVGDTLDNECRAKLYFILIYSAFLSHDAFLS